MIDQSLAPPPSVAELRRQVAQLAAVDGVDAGEVDLIDHLTVLEQVKSAAAAAQARVTATLVTTRARAEATRGVPTARHCRGLASEIALARHDSPHQGGRHLGLATALVHEMPHTLDALSRGEISEWRATILVRETAVLCRAHRTQVDTELAGHLTTLGDRSIAAAARKIGYRLDPGSALRRTRGANADRHVSLRPAPDTMTYLTGFLPSPKESPAKPPSSTTPTPCGLAATSAAAARSWPTHWSSGSPDRPPRPPCPSRSTW